MAKFVTIDTLLNGRVILNADSISTIEGSTKPDEKNKVWYVAYVVAGERRVYSVDAKGVKALAETLG